MREVYDSLSWSLLAAAPEFEGGIFDESVILVLEDAPEGSYGIMLNRPKGKLLADLNTGIDDALLGSLEVFDGGPVSENKLTFAVWKGPEAPGPGNFAYGLEGADCHKAIADTELNLALENKSKELGIPLISGDVLCSEVFDYYVKDLNALINRFPKDMNIIGAEMESFALFYTAKYLNKKAACLLTVVDSHYKKQEISAEGIEKSLNTMIKLALEAI